MKPCLVIGSGFHSWVLGDELSPLSNWNELINKVATVMQIAIPEKNMPPIFRWEELLQMGANDGYLHPNSAIGWIKPRAKKTSEIERDAKKALANVINSISYQSNSARAQYAIEKGFETVISLNYDHHSAIKPFCFGPTIKSEKVTGYSKKEFGRLFNRLTFNSNKNDIWYPNGCTEASDTIRVGLYDYGENPHAIKTAFKGIKSFEDMHPPEWSSYKRVIENEFRLQREDPNSADPRLFNWVAHFLYRPIYFAGVGLSQDEIGLWWLLSQRARNLSRISQGDHPNTMILIKSNDSRKDFWANRPFGVRAIECDNWSAGWEMIADNAFPKGFSGGIF
jgi:hypothetical protein